MDFVQDTFADGRPFRVFTVIDDFTRECPVIAVDTHLSSDALIAVLEQLASAAACPPRWSATMGASSRAGHSTRGSIVAGSSSSSSTQASR